jgi:hypothetical protein
MTAANDNTHLSLAREVALMNARRVRQTGTPHRFAAPGQALTLNAPHRKFGTCYAEFLGCTEDGQHIMVRKLISSMWKSRWTKPLKVARADVLTVHDRFVREG